MNIDLSILAQWAGAITAIFAVVKLVVQPFTNSIKRNDSTMKSLEKAIDILTYDLKDSQKDREKIHKTLDLHSDKIGRLEDDSIRNSERIATLFNRGKS